MPGLLLVDLTRPADSLLPGQVPAQDAKCPAVGNRLKSAPVSAMITSATRTLIPGIETIRPRAPRKGSITTSIRAVSSATVWVRDQQTGVSQ